MLIIDQALKIWIKTNMYLGEEIHVAGDWFILHFTENNGIAFGLEFAGRTGKLLLTVFRLFAAGLIGYFILQLIKKNAKPGLVYSISLIFAGAVGNILDSLFYGPLFGYENFLYGRVVDMFYFPILKGYFPDWLPIVGGDYFVFFRPVFNIADAAITVGVISILLFHRNVFKDF